VKDQTTSLLVELFAAEPESLLEQPTNAMDAQTAAAATAIIFFIRFPPEVFSKKKFIPTDKNLIAIEIQPAARRTAIFSSAWQPIAINKSLPPKIPFVKFFR
jgi:hypothetical protein